MSHSSNRNPFRAAKSRAALVASGALALTGLGISNAQAQLTMETCSRGIGQSASYELTNGRRGFPFLFLTSFVRGNFPMSAIDPRDSRSLGVGFDLLSLLLVGNFDATGSAKFSLPIPNDTSLAGRALLHQALGYPGTTTTFAGITNVAVVPLDTRGSWKLDVSKNMFFGRAWSTLIDEGDGRYLAAGGGTGALLALMSFDTSDRFDLATRSFTSGPKMTSVRGVHTASRLPDGRWILAAGVDGNNDPLDTSEYYEPATKSFKAGPKMLAKRMAHTATTLRDGRILVTGGLSDLNGQLAALGSALKTTEIFNPSTGTWSRGPDMREPKAGHTAQLLADGRVVLMGGVTWRNLIFIKVPSFSKQVDVFDPATGRMSALADMRKERAGQGAFLLADGRLLVAGGVGGSIVSGGTADASAEIYDPARNTWSTTGSMPVAKALATSVVMPDGRPAMIGGAAGTLLAPLAVDDCTVFNVSTGSWGALPKLRTPRTTHLSFLDSCVLVSIGGGSGTSGAAVKTAELLIQ